MAKEITKLKHRFPFRRFSWPPLLLLTAAAILSFLNYQPGTWLTGWDNLHPEFNFPLNLSNTIFSVWQERGPGFLAGMSPAADLPRILILGALHSLGVGGPHLRYLWTFSLLALGPIATYLLLHHIFLKQKFDPQTKKIAAFLGALFYLLNLATIQYFFIPFEAFTAFFALFPLLILAVTLHLEKSSNRYYFFLLFVLIVSSPAFFVQTLFLVLVVCLIPILASHFPHGKKKTIILLLTLFLTQSYWLLPQIFFVFTRAGEVSLSHTNLLSSSETLYRNLQFANLADLALLKGFWFNILDPSIDGKFDYLLLIWRNHLSNPVILAIGYLTFTLVVTGIIYSLKKRLPFAKSFLTIFLLSNVFLLGGIQTIGSKIPLLGELFRSPFSKFSIPLAMSYAIFFSVGVIFILDLFSFLHSRLTYHLTLFTVSVALIIFITPAFTGNLISPLMRVKIPTEYFELFDFFKKEDPASRIANFPQYILWGWNYYSWGYRGAGFLWYGIRQPLLDRGFDVWEKSSEKYYEEISAALYSENKAEFERLVDKYAINWILLDKNVITPNANQDLGNGKLLAILDGSPKFSLAKNINDKILIYQTDIHRQVKNFLSVGQPETNTRPFDLSLRPTKPEITNNQIRLSSSLPADTGRLLLPSYTQTENLVPAAIAYRKTDRGLQLKFTPILPKIRLGEKIIGPTPVPVFLDFILPEDTSGLVLGVNSQYLELQLPDELSRQTVFYPLTNLYLPSRAVTRVSLYSNLPAFRLDLTSALAAATPTQCYTRKPNRKVEKIVAGGAISLLGTDLVGCLSAPIPAASINQLLSLEFTHQSTTATPANANITNSLYGGESSPQPISAEKKPTFSRVFAKPLFEPMQANLILEANETKSTQEVIYKNITISYLPILGETGFNLPPLPATDLTVESGSVLTVSLPIVDSPLLVTTKDGQNLNSEPRNCDNFNSGHFDRQVVPDGLLYTAQNANSCDQVNLKHLPHEINYAVIVDNDNQKGLSPTICLENHATRRCDIFERLVNGRQLVLSPIANPNEPPGYTLHLFNESFGSRQTVNLLRSLTVSPFPLSYLKGITLTPGQTESPIVSPPVISSTHPAEFLYTTTVDNQTDQTLNLYQTKSPYWQALAVSEADFKLPLWQLIVKLPYLYYFGNRSAVLNHADSRAWHNAWNLPSGKHFLVIFYLPQYLEFVGLLLLPLPLLLFLKPKR